MATYDHEGAIHAYNFTSLCFWRALLEATERESRYLRTAYRDPDDARRAYRSFFRAVGTARRLKRHLSALHNQGHWQRKIYGGVAADIEDYRDRVMHIQRRIMLLRAGMLTL